MAMEDARYFCQQRHGDLVTINSEAESIFLWQQVIILSVNWCQEAILGSFHGKYNAQNALLVYLWILCRCMIFMAISGLAQSWTLINHSSEYKFNTPATLSAGWSAYWKWMDG